MHLIQEAAARRWFEAFCKIKLVARLNHGCGGGGGGDNLIIDDDDQEADDDDYGDGDGDGR